MTAPTRAVAVPLTRREVDMLATYNAEVWRGIVHTDLWKGSMRVLQDRHHRAMTAEYEAQVASANRPRRWRWW